MLQSKWVVLLAGAMFALQAGCGVDSTDGSTSSSAEELQGRGGSSSGSASGGSSNLPPSHPAVAAGTPCSSCHGGGSSGSGSSGGSFPPAPPSGSSSLPPNHPAVAAGTPCSSCHGGGSSGNGSSGGSFPPAPPGGSSSGRTLPAYHPSVPAGTACSQCHGGGSSGGSSSGGNSPPAPPNGSSSGGTSPGGNLPTNHPSVPAGTACSTCHGAGTPGDSSSGGSSSGSPCGYTSNTSALAVSSGSQTTSGQTYTATAQNESGVCVQNSGSSLTLTNPKIVTSGNSSSTDSSSFYGLNAAALAYSGGSLTITGGSITTSGSGANGVFAYGSGAIATITGVTIKATGDGGHGLEAAGGGTLVINDVTATTDGPRGSVVATDRGDGNKVTVEGGTYTANGQRSAGIYSTGEITASDAAFTSTKAEAIVIEGSNSATLTNCALSSTNSSSNRGIMVYQSFSGDASVGTGKVTMTGGSYTWNSSSSTSAAFYVTNTTAAILLNGVVLKNPAGYLLLAEANSNWGTTGSNGGHVTFNNTAQTLSGDIVVDSISTLTASFQNGSSFTGAIDAAKQAKTVNVALDASSTWHVTAASRVTTLTGVSLSGSVVTNIAGSSSADVCYRTQFVDTQGTTHTTGTYSLASGGSLKPCG